MIQIFLHSYNLYFVNSTVTTKNLQVSYKFQYKTNIKRSILTGADNVFVRDKISQSLWSVFFNPEKQNKNLKN